MISQNRKTIDIYAVDSFETYRCINKCLKNKATADQEIISAMIQVKKLLIRNYSNKIFIGNSTNKKIRVNSIQAAKIVEKIEKLMQGYKIPVNDIDTAISLLHPQDSLYALYRAMNGLKK